MGAGGDDIGFRRIDLGCDEELCDEADEAVLGATDRLDVDLCGDRLRKG